MDSKMRPLWLVFQNQDSLGEDILQIFKSGDGMYQNLALTLLGCCAVENNHLEVKGDTVDCHSSEIRECQWMWRMYWKFFCTALYTDSFQNHYSHTRTQLTLRVSRGRRVSNCVYCIQTLCIKKRDMYVIKYCKTNCNLLVYHPNAKLTPPSAHVH